MAWKSAIQTVWRTNRKPKETIHAFASLSAAGCQNIAQGNKGMANGNDICTERMISELAVGRPPTWTKFFLVSVLVSGCGCKLYCEEEEQAKEIREKPQRSTAKWRVFTDMARELFGQGKVDQALEFLEKATREAELGFGDGDEHVAASYQNLAELLRINGNFKEAEKFYKKAIFLLENNLADDASISAEQQRAIPVDENSADVHNDNNDEFRSFKGNSFITKEMRHKALATTCHNLCSLYLQLGPDKLEEARQCYQKALRLKIEAFGSGHNEVANTLAHVAELNRQEGKYQQALDMLEQSLQVLCEQGNGDKDRGPSQMINRTFRMRSYQLARMQLKHGKDDKAKSNAEQVLWRLVKFLCSQSDFEMTEEECIKKDLTLSLLLCESLVRSGKGVKCREALSLIEATRSKIVSLQAYRTQREDENIAKNKRLFQIHLALCTLNRLFVSACFCLGDEDGTTFDIHNAHQKLLGSQRMLESMLQQVSDSLGNANDNQLISTYAQFPAVKNRSSEQIQQVENIKALEEITCESLFLQSIIIKMANFEQDPQQIEYSVKKIQKLVGGSKVLPLSHQKEIKSIAKCIIDELPS